MENKKSPEGERELVEISVSVDRLEDLKRFSDILNIPLESTVDILIKLGFRQAKYAILNNLMHLD